MVVKISGEKALLKKLKKRAHLLQHREQQSRTKLRAALKKMHELGKGYKTKLASKARVMKNKIAETQSSSYAKAAADIERQLIKSIEAKAKALRSVVTRLEKKSISKLTKDLAKKNSKARSTKKAR